jgi:predicted dehydrogenase
LKLGIHVLSEVPAGTSIEECRELVLAARNSSGLFMMAENCNYLKEIMLVRELARRGQFGDLYFAEGEYIHELKELSEATPWRRKWQTGINGNTYPTHSLGPILQWMAGDRVTSVCCAGSGHHYRDSGGREFENEDTTLTLCRTQKGALIKLRLDMLSDRPEAINTYQLQGRDGCYESGRAPGEPGRVWLRSRSGGHKSWLKTTDLEPEFLPPEWKQLDPREEKTGHGGSDRLVILDFFNSIITGQEPSIDIDAAMDMTLPGIASQLSISRGSEWVDVPDSRQWRSETPTSLNEKSVLNIQKG